MKFFKNPDWIDKDLLRYNLLEEISEETIQKIRFRLQSKMSHEPLVTVIIAAWNEEVNIIRCLDTLSKNETNVPFDILIVNNNSNDRTQEVLDKLGVQSYFQPIQGCGPARDLGQRQAKGKYVLIADADCFYPKRWIDIMVKGLLQKDVVLVYGRFSFLGSPLVPRWKYSVYEIIRDMVVEMRHVKRPYLSAYGISMGYIKELGIKEGYLERNIRGDDGRLCFDLMKYGKIKLIRSSATRVWTGSRTLEREGNGNLFYAIKIRTLREMVRFDKYFTNPIPLNTKTSDNEIYSAEENWRILKAKYNPLRIFRKKKQKKHL